MVGRVARTTGIASGDAVDVNRATDFDGSQYLNLAAKNLVKADDTIAYASNGDWAAPGTGTLASYVAGLLSADGISTSGLPSGIKTALKFTVGDTGEFATLAKTLTNAAHSISFWVYPVSTTETFRSTKTDYPDNTAGAYVSCPAGQWTEVEHANWNPGDANPGTLGVESENTVVQVVYITAFQVEQNSSTTAWDPNALFSFGDQDFWVSVWVRPDVASDTSAVVSLWGGAGYRSFQVQQNGATWELFLSQDGTDSPSKAATQIPVAGVWTRLFVYFDSSGNTGAIIVDNGSAETVAVTTVHQPADAGADCEVGAANGAVSFDGRIDSVMFGCAAAGLTDSFATVAALLWNNSKGLKYGDLSTAQKASIGLVEAFDLEDDSAGNSFLGQHSAVQLTNNGSLTAGDSAGVNYAEGFVSLAEDQSGEGNDFAQLAIGLRPLHVSNVFGTNPGWKFGGAVYLSALGGNLFTGEVGAVYFLVRLTSVSGVQAALSQADSAVADDYQSFLAIGSTTKQTVANNDNGAGAVESAGDTTVLIDTTYIMCVRSNGSLYTHRLDGADDGQNDKTGSPAGEWMADLGTPDATAIGARILSTVDNFLVGYLGPIIVFDGAEPTAREQQTVEAFLDQYNSGALGLQEPSTATGAGARLLVVTRRI